MPLKRKELPLIDETGAVTVTARSVVIRIEDKELCVATCDEELQDVITTLQEALTYMIAERTRAYPIDVP